MFILATEDEAIANVTKRHCRIGKVSPKFRLRGDLDIAKPLPGSPMDRFTFQWPMVYADPGTPAMCRQCIGKACGNVACPSRLIAT